MAIIIRFGVGTGWEGQEGRAVPRFCKHCLYGSDTDEGKGGRSGQSVGRARGRRARST